MGMGDEATTPFLSRIGAEIFQNYGLFSHSAKRGKNADGGQGGRAPGHQGAGGRSCARLVGEKILSELFLYGIISIASYGIILTVNRSHLSCFTTKQAHNKGVIHHRPTTDRPQTTTTPPAQSGQL